MRRFAAKLAGLLVAVGLASACMAARETPRMRIAMIFDDGPVPEMGGKFLGLFAAEKIPVTFALVAQNVEAHPDLAEAMIAAGHEIANHSYAHLHPAALEDTALEHEIVGAQKVFAKLLSVAPRWYWPPFVEYDDRVRAMAGRAGIKVFVPRNLVVSMDYDRTVGGDEIFRRSTSGVVDGSLLLFHEWREETFEQMPAILAELRRQGCVFLTVSGLAAAVGTGT